MKATTIGRRARAIRTQKGLTQAEVARRAEWHVTDLCNFEKGRGPEEVGTLRLVRLAKALGETVDVLLTPHTRSV